MRSNAARAGLAVALAALAVVLFIVLEDDDDGGGGGETTPTTAADTGGQGKRDQGEGGAGRAQEPAVPTIVVKDGRPVGGVRELDYERGDEVRFRVVSDVSDEMHVHGYDISKDVEAGRSVSFDFPADIEGVFEAELENRKEQIIELRVNPG
jgi:hypothetical protein